MSRLSGIGEPIVRLPITDQPGKRVFVSRHLIEFARERLELELADDAFLGGFSPPAGLSASAQEAALREALENPTNYPPLRRAVVPGDRVAIALDPEIVDPRPIVSVLAELLQSAGVQPDDLLVVDSPDRTSPLGTGPLGTWETHDPTNSDRLAYLAATASGTRVYLNRTLTDAEVVIPIGLVRQDQWTGRRGPWSVIYPGFSDEAARQSRPSDELDELGGGEAAEVSWLLGAHFQVGVLPGAEGPSGFVAGLAEDVRKASSAILDRDWTFRPESRAETVVAGIAGLEGATGLEELVAGLAAAGALVERGGKIIALSRAQGTFGPALKRLAEADDLRSHRTILRGREADPDFSMAQTLARVLDWADVYLLSSLDPEAVEDLSIIPLDRPEEGRRLASKSSSCLILNCAERVQVKVQDQT